MKQDLFPSHLSYTGIGMRKGYYLIFALNIALFVLGYIVVSGIDKNTLRLYIENKGMLAPIIYLGIYLLLIIVPFNPLPKTLFTYLALLVFGPFIALILTLLGDAFGISINYRLAFVYKNYFKRFIPGEGKTRKFQNITTGILILSRIIPVTDGFFGADLPSYLAGLISFSYIKFLSVSLLIWFVLDVVYFFGLYKLQSLGAGKVLALVGIFSFAALAYKMTKKR